MHVVTFYSFKGGLGRTLALLNVAYELASADKDVLVVDFDLEAPGIRADSWSRRGFEYRVDQIDTGRPGVVEYVGEYLRTMRVPDVERFIFDAAPQGSKYTHIEMVSPDGKREVTGDVEGPPGGRIAVLPSGILDDTYGRRLHEIDWNDLYERRDGYVMFEDTRAQWERLGFDYVLLDSRTGFTDVGGICTRHLPDAVVVLFRPDVQDLRGTREVVRAIRREEPTPRRRVAIAMHLVMTGIPDVDDEDGILEDREDIVWDDLSVAPDHLLQIRRYQSMDLLDQPVYTDMRPGTRLARSYRELTKRIRWLNVADREGVLHRLGQASTLDGYGGRPDVHSEFRRIKGRYASDREVLSRLAALFIDRGWLGDAEDLLAAVAGLGPLTGAEQYQTALLRQLGGNREGACQALHDFFRQRGEEHGNLEKPGSALITKALELLDKLGEDRASYVARSPLVEGLEPSDRWTVARRLVGSRSERREAASILEDALADDELQSIWRALYTVDLASARIAVGDFQQAMDCLRPALEDLGAYWSHWTTAFRLAMAEWGCTGVPGTEAFALVLDIAEQDNGDRDGIQDPTYLQSMAVAEWFAGHPERAAESLDKAEHAIRRKRRDISCWSYTRVPRDTFLKHCAEIRRLLAGEDVEPAFMRREACEAS